MSLPSVAVGRPAYGFGQGGVVNALGRHGFGFSAKQAPKLDDRF